MNYREDISHLFIEIWDKSESGTLGDGAFCKPSIQVPKTSNRDGRGSSVRIPSQPVVTVIASLPGAGVTQLGSFGRLPPCELYNSLSARSHNLCQSACAIPPSPLSSLSIPIDNSIHNWLAMESQRKRKKVNKKDQIHWTHHEKGANH